jgi:hypothetical protein
MEQSKFTGLTGTKEVIDNAAVKRKYKLATLRNSKSALGRKVTALYFLVDTDVCVLVRFSLVQLRFIAENHSRKSWLANELLSRIRIRIGCLPSKA